MRKEKMIFQQERLNKFEKRMIIVHKNAEMKQDCEFLDRFYAVLKNAAQ